MSADVEQLPRLHPALGGKAPSHQVEASPRGGGLGSQLEGSPRRVACRICEEAVARDALQRHSRVCAMLEAIYKQVRRCAAVWLPSQPASAGLAPTPRPHLVI